MKEITIRLADDISDRLTHEAKEKGLTPEELIKYILGTYVQGVLPKPSQLEQGGLKFGIYGSLQDILKSITEDMAGIGKEALKQQARVGALSCKRCTMRLSEQDVENGKCGACGVPLEIALKGDKEGDNPK